MTLKEILKLLQYSYPRQQFENENIKAYTMMLQDVDQELLRLAAFQLIRESTFFPSIAELISRVADLELEREGHLPAIAAYEIAMKGGRLRDRYPDILRAVEMSCGDTYNLRSGENTAADRARFMEAYEEITKHKRGTIINSPAAKAFFSAAPNKPGQLTEGGDVHTH